jgi:hypothetical protein
MSEPKFTKGPWRVGKPFFQSTSKQNVTPILWSTPSCGECGKSDGEWLVAWTFPNSLKKPQYKFNAQLIAAAPDLCEAVRKAIQLASIASDWNLDEVEIDGEMVNTYRLREEFEAAFSKAAGVK